MGENSTKDSPFHRKKLVLSWDYFAKDSENRTQLDHVNDVLYALLLVLELDCGEVYNS